MLPRTRGCRALAAALAGKKAVVPFSPRSDFRDDLANSATRARRGNAKTGRIEPVAMLGLENGVRPAFRRPARAG